MITLIAAIGRNNEIGYRNKLLWNIPEDMAHFKTYTMGKTLVMGINTFASIGSKPLPGRKCIVISHTKYNGSSAIHAGSIAEALSVEHCFPEMVVIGGASIYNQTIALADKLVITHVDADFTADTYFPRIDLTKWQIIRIIQGSPVDQVLNYKFVEYQRTI